MVKSLCVTYSSRLLSLPPPAGPHSAEEAYHPFPPPSALAAPEVTAKLRSLGFGYRADFIQKTAAMLVDAHGTTPIPQTQIEPSEEWLRTLRTLSTQEARTELLKLMGVGRKVADCILLMSLDKVRCPPCINRVGMLKKFIATEGSHSGRYTCPPDCCQTLWSARSVEDGNDVSEVIR